MIIPVFIWSDIACPWCFVGKTRLDAAIRQIATESPGLRLQVRWRAFELDPRPREPSTKSYAERLAAKYQRTVEQAQEMIEAMTRAIADAGGRADFAKVIAANTFNAHRLIQWAGDTDRVGQTSNAQHRLTDAFMRGYLGDGLNLGRDEEMLDVVSTLGLSRAAAADVLASQRYADAVRADEQAAQHHGIHGVPFFVIGGYGLSGAQPSDTLVDVIRQVQSEQGNGR